MPGFLLVGYSTICRAKSPEGFTFGPDPSEPEEDDSSVLLSAAVLMAGAAAFVWVVRNVKGDEAE